MLYSAKFFAAGVAAAEAGAPGASMTADASASHENFCTLPTDGRRLVVRKWAWALPVRSCGAADDPARLTRFVAPRADSTRKTLFSA